MKNNDNRKSIHIKPINKDLLELLKNPRISELIEAALRIFNSGDKLAINNLENTIKYIDQTHREIEALESKIDQLETDFIDTEDKLLNSDLLENDDKNCNRAQIFNLSDYKN